MRKRTWDEEEEQEEVEEAEEIREYELVQPAKEAGKDSNSTRSWVDPIERHEMTPLYHGRLQGQSWSRDRDPYAGLM